MSDGIHVSNGLRFKTISGSTYEVIPEEKLVRRLTGMHLPTPRQGVDGEWKSYHGDIAPLPGLPVFFDWTGRGNGTITSTVVEMEKVDIVVPLKP